MVDRGGGFPGSTATRPDGLDTIDMIWDLRKERRNRLKKTGIDSAPVQVEIQIRDSVPAQCIDGEGSEPRKYSWNVGGKNKNDSKTTGLRERSEAKGWAEGR